MSKLRSSVEDYLAIRRSLGFTLERTGKLLPEFVAYLDPAGSQTITIALALDWAMANAGATPRWWAQRLTIVRGFARFLHAIDESPEIPPTGLLPGHGQQLTPFLYSDAAITAMMNEAARLVPDWRAASYQTLIGLLATTGMRLGEALGLNRDDVDFADGWILIRHGKGGSSREIAVQETTVEALSHYCRVCEKQWPEPRTPAFFVAMHGARLGSATVHDNFRQILERSGVGRNAVECHPRPHDLQLRHTHRAGLVPRRHGRVDAQLPTLSTWLGHSGPSSTYCTCK